MLKIECMDSDFPLLNKILTNVFGYSDNSLGLIYEYMNNNGYMDDGEIVIPSNIYSGCEVNFAYLIKENVDILDKYVNDEYIKGHIDLFKKGKHFNEKMDVKDVIEYMERYSEELDCSLKDDFASETDMNTYCFYLTWDAEKDVYLEI